MHTWLPFRSLHFVYQMSSLSYSHSTNKYTKINYMAQFRITNRFTSKGILYTNIMKRSSLCKREMNIRLRTRISFKDIFRNMIWTFEQILTLHATILIKHWDILQFMFLWKLLRCIFWNIANIQHLNFIYPYVSKIV